MDKKAEYRSNLGGRNQVYRTCPECSHTRKTNKKQRCLSITRKGSGFVWLCHHCRDTGGEGEGNEGGVRPKPRRNFDARRMAAWEEAYG